ncbi:siderochrome-iron transporter [Xylariales sp. PMI_506]|nr:siderochrome-iron transporter [Xylariales sp. PMI_506]
MSDINMTESKVAATNEKGATAGDYDDVEKQHAEVITGDIAGATKIEAIKAVWGKNGRLFVILALVFCMIAYEVDNTTIYTYFVYAQSNFSEVTQLAAVTTAGGILFSVLKPFIAKLSDVVGREELYPVWMVLYIVANALAAASPNYQAYAAAYMLHIFGQTGVNTLNDILASDISTSRQRGFAIQFQFLPYLFMPFAAAYIVDDTIGGIGWRWGIGIDAIVMTVGLLPLIGLLTFWRRKSSKLGYVSRSKTTAKSFFSEIDAVGLLIFSSAFCLILVPVSMGGTAVDGWKTSWVIACIVLGALLLIALPFYEHFVAKHPFMPARYFRDRTIGMALLLYGLDGISLGVTHSYFYTWLIVARDYTVSQATLINSANGTMQLFAGIIAGLILWYTRRYKWLTVAAIFIRFLGYGLMMRIRNASSTTAELVVVQLIQGVGDGLVGTTAFVAATVAVPHKEMAAMTSLAVCFSTIGGTIGSAIGGSLYTTYFVKELEKTLGTDNTSTLISNVVNSITTGLPAWGTTERDEIAVAYNQVMAYMTYVAFAVIAPNLIFALVMPDRRLTDTHNLVEDQPEESTEDTN